MEAGSTLPFDSRKQLAILGHLITNERFFRLSKGKLRPEWFNDPRAGKVYAMQGRYAEKHGRAPTFDELWSCPEMMAEPSLAEQRSLQGIMQTARVETGSFGLDALRSELTQWLHSRVFTEGVQKAVNLYNAGKFGQAFDIAWEKINEIRTTTFEEEAALSFANPASYLQEAVTSYDRALTTGLTILDDALVPGNDSQGRGGLFRGDITILMAPANIGKCLGLNTPVLMYDGSTKMSQDIRVGDRLMGPDSKPRTVESTTVGRGQLYRIVPKSGGTPWVCNDVHLLNLKCVHNPRSKGERGIAHNRKFYDGATENISVKDYLKQNREYKTHMRLWRTGVEFETQTRGMPISPYVLGLWLGDGHSHAASLTTADKEIADAWSEWVRSNGDQIAVYTKKDNKAAIFAARCAEKEERIISKLVLSGLGVLGNKHIPTQYLRGSRQVRLELLAGLIDTDGYTNKGSRCSELVTVSDTLAKDYAALAGSLGFKVTVNQVQKSIKSTGFTGTYWSVMLRGRMSEIPVRLERKKSPDSKKDPNVTGFRVEDEGVGDYYGFTLKEQDGLFMLGDYTVTHNTTCLITMAVKNALMGRKVLFMTHEGRPSDIREKMLQCALRVDKKTLFEAYKDPATLMKVEFFANQLERNLTYIPYNKAGMVVEDVIPVIRRRQESLMAATNSGYDMILSDYPAKLGTVKAAGGHLQQRHIDAIVYENYVQLALELDCHVVAAVQTNRQGSISNRDDERLLTMEDVAESWGVMTAATNVLTLNRDQFAAQNNRLTFYVAKSRSSEVGRAVVARTAYSKAVTHDDELGGTWYRGDSSMSDRIDDLLAKYDGKAIPDLVV